MDLPCANGLFSTSQMKLRALFLVVFLMGIRVGYASPVVIRDTVYTPPGYSDGVLFATLYFPDQPNGAAVIAVHELGATRSTLHLWCDTLAAHGYLVMTIDYPDPVNNRATFPAPPRALKVATQFLRRNATAFHIDAERIGAFGRSLGAGVIGECIIADGDTALLHTDGTVDDHLNAAVMLYGIYDFRHHTQTNLGLSIPQFASLYFQGNASQERQATAVLNASKVTTPVLLIHGTADATLQVEQSSEFHDSLSVYGKSNELVLFSGQPHVFETTGNNAAFTPAGLTVKDSAEQFFARALAPRSEVRSPAPISLPAQPFITGIFPNPSSRTATIRFSVPRTEAVSLKVFDVMGAEVATLVSGSMEAGLHDAHISTEHMPTGLYWCRLAGDGAVNTTCVRVVR